MVVERLRSASRATLGLSIVFALSSLVLAQAGRRQQTPAFKGAADLIPVDVSVLDKQGQPVHGLTANDFAVRENGHVQTVQAFSAIDLPDEAKPDGPSWTHDVAPDVVANTAVLDERVIVIVLDDAMVPDDRQIVSSTKTIGREIVARLGPNDLAAVIFTRNNRGAQEFTHDRARLLAAVQTFDWGGAVPPTTNLRGNLHVLPNAWDTLSVLRRVSEQLASLSQRRKALIFVSVGLPWDPGEATEPGSFSGETDGPRREVLAAAQQANVNIYSVDPGGLDGMHFYLANQTKGPAAVGPRGEPLMDGAADRATLYRNELMALSDNTGGHAFINSNEFASKIAQIFRETGSFYLLGYVSTDARTDGNWRRIEVKVNRPGVTVHARTGYFAPKAQKGKAPALPPPSPGLQAMSGLVPDSTIPLRLAAAPFATPGSAAAAVAIDLGIGARGTAVGQPDDFDVLIEAFTFDGVRRQTVRVTRHVASVPGEPDADITARLDLPPGRYQVRAAATSRSTGTAGSVYADLDVPDFQKAPLSLSGLVIVGTAAGMNDALGALVPGTPLTRRTFTTTDRLSAFVRVYTGRAPVEVTATWQLTDATNQTRFTQPMTLGPDRFANGAADLPIALPLSTLTSGEYCLSLTATAGSTPPVRRDLRFVVK